MYRQEKSEESLSKNSNFICFVHESLAIEKGIKAEELEAIVFPHPTVGEIIKEALR